MTKRQKASNWIDRGEGLEGKLCRVLGAQCQRDPNDPDLEYWASTIRGMVEADASEVQVSNYLGTLPHTEELSAPSRRILAIALWHIAKSGLVRDDAARQLDRVRAQLPPDEPLAVALERAIVNAPERNRYEPPSVPPKETKNV